jgi:hypothetical protein
MKVPQLRNLYQKTGFNDSPGAVNKRGAGFTHDGAIDDLFDFLKFTGFNFAAGAAGDAQRRDLEAYLHAFDTGMAPAVGAEVTFDGSAADAPRVARMDTLVTRAAAGDCDLVARGRVSLVPHSWTLAGGLWTPDVTGAPSLTSAELRSLAGPGHELTLTGVPAGSGTRMGHDRDRDGFPDGDERAAGSDAGDPSSTPATVSADGGPLLTHLAAARPNPFRGGTRFEFSLARAARVELSMPTCWA